MSNRNSFIESTKETDDRLEALKQLYPEIFSDGKINLDAFKDVTGTSDLPEGQDKTPGYYGLYWPGKRAAKQLARKEAEGTLEPVLGDGVNEDTTHNIYIEGDNLEVLRILKQSYKGRVKMIYIDPPYNTGNDFIYPDDFKMPIEEYLKMTGQADESGKMLVSNSKTNGAFHTNWLNMMYPRLQLARECLAEDGVIFISIDDNEQANLKLLCDDVFGEENFITCLVWEKKKKGAFLSKHYINMKEYILVYVKDSDIFNGLVGEINTNTETYPCIKTTNARGIRIIKKGTISKNREKNYIIKAGTRISSGNMELIYLDDLVIENSILQKDVRVDSNWIYGQDALDGFAEKNLLYITQDNYIRRIVDEDRTKMLKDLLTRVGADGESLNYFKYDINLNNGGWGTNEDANDELHTLLGAQYVFDFSKPSRLITKLIQTIDDKNALVMDFFAGSSTIAHAVMKLNSCDGGRRKYINVQMPSEIERNEYATKAGYKNICEIGKERIRRAGIKILEEVKENKDLFSKDNPLDIGFKVYRLQKSNFEKYTPVEGQTEESKNMLFQELENNLIPLVNGWKPENVLTEIILRQGFALDCTKEKLDTFKKNKIWKITDANDAVSKKIKLYVCLDNVINEDTIKALTLGDDEKFICLDSAIDDSSYAKLSDKGRIETI